MRRKPFKNSSHKITGGSFKSDFSQAFSKILKEEEKEEQEKALKEEQEQEKSSSDILKELERNYKKILKKKSSLGTARYVYSPDYPKVSFISFKATNSQAVWEATKFFHDFYNPYFIGMSKEDIMKVLKARRIPELDEYAKEGKVPIYALMQKAKATFSCFVCGKHEFEYADYCNNVCFILEGDVNPLPYAKGCVLCYKCHQKLCT